LSSVVEPFSSSSRWKWGCQNREKRDVQFESFPLCTRKVWTSWVEVNRWEMPLCFPGMLWSFCCDLYVGSLRLFVHRDISYWQAVFLWVLSKMAA
jgi:hypothetical protein